MQNFLKSLKNAGGPSTDLNPSTPSLDVLHFSGPPVHQDPVPAPPTSNSIANIAGLIVERDSAMNIFETKNELIETQYDIIQQEINELERNLQDEKTVLARIQAEAATAAANEAANHRKVLALKAEIEAEIGSEKFSRWDESRGGNYKPRPALPVALEGVSGNVLKEYLVIKRPASQPVGDGHVLAGPAAKPAARSSKLRGGAGLDDSVPHASEIGSGGM
ncbi:hypothetical protein C8R46DRAFT_1140866 [Mycena filopes]|nr:hypothetical protein C8R46DRAFT_1140866 [Mycena filopes]